MKEAVKVLGQLAQVQLEEVHRQMEVYAAKGYRTLGVAVEEKGHPLRLAGLLTLYDPPRPDAPSLIEGLKKLGLKIEMLTGDAQPIAQEIARQVGLGDRILSATALREKWKSSPQEAALMAEEGDGFAEVYPEDKYNIMQALQSRGHIVGMTGDGVNDAPPLRQAEVGIAVSNATDVAKGAASVVLTGEGLANIVDLVKVGRMICQRVLTWVFNKMAKTFQIVLFVVLAFLLTRNFVVTTFDVVLLLFLIDFVTLAIATDNARWSPHPDAWNIKDIVKSSLILGLLVVAESLFLLFWGMHYGGDKGVSPAEELFLGHTVLHGAPHGLCGQGEGALLVFSPQLSSFGDNSGRHSPVHIYGEHRHRPSGGSPSLRPSLPSLGPLRLFRLGYK